MPDRTVRALQSLQLLQIPRTLNARASRLEMSSVLVTRRIPASALAILRQSAEVDLAEGGLDAVALRDRVRGTSAVVCLLTEDRKSVV